LKSRKQDVLEVLAALLIQGNSISVNE